MKEVRIKRDDDVILLTVEKIKNANKESLLKRNICSYVLCVNYAFKRGIQEYEYLRTIGKNTLNKSLTLFELTKFLLTHKQGLGLNFRDSTIYEILKHLKKVG